MNIFKIALVAAPLLLAGCGSNDQESKIDARLVINTDRNASELSWTITNSRLEVVASGSGYENSTHYDIDLGFDPGGYRIDFKDAGNDGLCCSYGEGNIELYVANQLILSDNGDFGEFTDLLSQTFVAGDYQNTYQQELSGYYADADLLDGYLLKTALHRIIKQGYNQQSYSGVWDFFALGGSEDKYYEQDASILDIYSEVPNGADPYNYTIGDDQCGNYKGEGDCYNREHVMPKSWFDDGYPMYSDVNNLYATDGYVNGIRGNLPYGEVDPSTVNFTSGNGSKRGMGHDELGYTQAVFEPIDEFKGDIARVYFYMATRYEDVINVANQSDDWYEQSDETYAVFEQNSSDQVYRRWFVEMMMRWHQQDPVSQREKDRNEKVFEFQGNRNPFIDHPEFVEQIWGKEGFEAAKYYFN
ncbi:HNH endonuclease signature motif containing protein [Agarivorans sp. QJM3NY_29]|uniref:HNH endonuclease signature motif containing protein n=1 Tax=unclassified Agarivorans TaxID=2636026 RepID=UPI003D7F05B6